jgi:3-hydroxybutyryl-CoA dehydrogenase
MNAEEIRKVLVVGAGTMGQQIALQCATHGLAVTLYDVAGPALETAMATIRGYATYLTGTGDLTQEGAAAALARILPTTDPQAGADADLLSESVPEDPLLKGRVLAQFNAICPPRTVFTTNSSTLLPSMFAEASGRPAQLAALHFHGYVWESNVVDIMPHAGTDPSLVPLLVAFAHRIGQIPIVLQQESSGYVFNSMLSAVFQAALGLAAGGVATVPDIDRAWMGIMKMPIGPLGIIDKVGLDTVWDGTHYWAGVTGDPGLARNAAFLKGYLARGELGIKSGRGFYSYPDPEFSRPGFVTGE